MTREEITALCKSEVLGPAAALFGATQDALRLYDPFEGCQNLVYDYERDGRPMILRISYRPDRSVGQIRAEVHFVNYLGDHGVRVARAQPSRQRNLVETLQAGGILFSVVCFEKGKGMRVPDNHYRYRENTPIEEYFQNWGQVLGQMHALTKTYRPISASVKRPTWFELEPSRGIDRVPDTLPRVRDKFERLLAQLRALPEDRDAYGLIHGDFNDGNFTVDYDNGDITVFDFDDACYFWFAHELACAWEGGIGRTMYRGMAERQAFMDHYMEQVLEGYTRENGIDDYWLDQIPLFLKVVEMEEFLHYVQYIEEADEELQAALQYKIRCIENDVPYLGFFDSIYSPERPFCL